MKTLRVDVCPLRVFAEIQFARMANESGLSVTIMQVSKYSTHPTYNEANI